MREKNKETYTLESTTSPKSRKASARLRSSVVHARPPTKQRYSRSAAAMEAWRREGGGGERETERERERVRKRAFRVFGELHNLPH